MKQRDYWDYLQDIIDAIDAVQNFVEGMNKNSFANEPKIFIDNKISLRLFPLQSYPPPKFR